MSQLDLVHFFPTLFWAICSFCLFYLVFNAYFVIIFYKNMRCRNWFENIVKRDVSKFYNSKLLYRINSIYVFFF